MNALFAAGDEGVSKFVRVVMRKDPLDRRVDGVHAGRLRLFKVDVRHDLSQHRRDRDLSRHDVTAQLFLARVAFQPMFVEHAQRLQFASAHSRVEQDEQGVGRREFSVRDAVVDELFFLFVGERASLLALMPGKHDLRHRRIEVVIFGGKVKDAPQDQQQFFRRAVFVLVYVAKEEILHGRAVDLRQRLVRECGREVVVEEASVLFEGGGLRRLFFERQPALCKVVEENGMLRFRLRATRGGIVLQRLQELLFQDGQVLGRDFDVDPLAVVSRFVYPVRLLAIGNDPVALCKYVSVLVWHFIDLLSVEFDAIFSCLFFRLRVFLRCCIGENVAQLGISHRLGDQIQHERSVVALLCDVARKERAHQLVSFLLGHSPPFGTAS